MTAAQHAQVTAALTPDFDPFAVRQAIAELLAGRCHATREALVERVNHVS
jgi:hypothetical protein